MKKSKGNSWAKLLEEEVKKENERPENALTCSEIMRMTGLGRSRVRVLISKLVSNKKARAVEARAKDAKGRSIHTVMYILEG